MATMRKPEGDLGLGGVDIAAVAPVVPRVMGGLKRADDQLVAFVQERPVVALGAALAVGYVIGRVLTRFG